MRIVKIVDIPIDKIEPNPNQVRETFDEEIIEGMAKSIKKIGLTNPITVRKVNSKYQIIAGEIRFRASKKLNKKEIHVKIVEADDEEADIISLTENFHHKDLTSEEREQNIYTSWKRGKKKGIYHSMLDMHEATGIPESTLQKNIASAKEKEDKNNIDIKEIQGATAWELDITRKLNKFAPKTRKEILHQSVIEKKLNTRDIENIVKAVNIISDMKISTPDEVLKEIPRLVADNNLKSTETEEFLKDITEIPKEEEQIQFLRNIKKEEKVDIYKIKNFVDTYVTSPPDIQKKLMEKKIDVDEAKVVSKFRTKEAREQVIEERKIIAELKEKELEKHTNIRVKQEEEVERYGDRKLGNLTKMDIEKIIQEFEGSDEQVDNDAIDNYREATSKIKKLFQVSTMKNMHSDKNKKIIIEFIKQVYEHCYEILLEIGEIKVIDDVGTKTSPVPKKLYGQ